MPFDIYEDYFWSYEKYYELTNEKKDAFLKTYESRSMLEWNLPDYQAFKKLSSEPRFSQD